jgi:hypothetical protein
VGGCAGEGADGLGDGREELAAWEAGLADLEMLVEAIGRCVRSCTLWP